MLLAIRLRLGEVTQIYSSEEMALIENFMVYEHMPVYPIELFKDCHNLVGLRVGEKRVTKAVPQDTQERLQFYSSSDGELPKAEQDRIAEYQFGIEKINTLKYSQSVEKIGQSLSFVVFHWSSLKHIKFRPEVTLMELPSVPSVLLSALDVLEGCPSTC